MNHIKPKAGQIYLIAGIHPECSWYGESHYFENKFMQCVEIFEAEESAGFRFIKKSDCPDRYNPEHAFCFRMPSLTPGALPTPVKAPGGYLA